MTFHRKMSTLTAVATLAAAAAAPGGAVEYPADNGPRPVGFDAPIIGRPGKYRGPRNKPPSQAKRRRIARRQGCFS